jgi:hypothetical protein
VSGFAEFPEHSAKRLQVRRWAFARRHALTLRTPR